MTSPAPGIALVGYGAIAEMHVAALAAAGASPRIVVGPKAAEVESFAARHGIDEATTELDAAIERADVDAVVIASPSQVHAEQSRAALAAGRHVLVEIPLALSEADGRALVATADAAGLTLMACHTLRYWEPIGRAREWLATSGGVVRHVVARGLSLRLEDVGWTGRRRSWTDDVLWHHGGHVIDEVLRFLASPVVDVRAAAGPVWEVNGHVMDYAITLRTEDGAIGSIALSYNARIGASDTLVITDRDTLRISGADVETSDGPLVAGVDGADAQTAAVAAQDADFLAAIGGGPSPRADAASILPVLAVQQRVADLTSA